MSLLNAATNVFRTLFPEAPAGFFGSQKAAQ